MIKLIKIENYTQKIKKDIILNDINLHLKENKIYGYGLNSLRCKVHKSAIFRKDNFS